MPLNKSTTIIADEDGNRVDVHEGRMQSINRQGTSMYRVLERIADLLTSIDQRLERIENE